MSYVLLDYHRTKMNRRKRRKLVPLHIWGSVEELFEMEVEPVRPDEKYHDKTLPMLAEDFIVIGKISNFSS